MKLSNGDTVLAGMTEVAVEKLISLTTSVNEKDQTIGALREQIKTLEQKIEDVKAEATAKQAMVIIQKGNKSNATYTKCSNCGYNFYTTSDNCPNCGYYNSTGKETKEYKNLDTVIDDIRKEEAVKLGIDLVEMDKKLNELTIEKMKLQNQLTLKVAELEESLKFEKKEKDAAINLAKERIRKQKDEVITALEDRVDELREELKKTKNDKTDAAIEEARKQEIIDLKERITELEKPIELPKFGWFKQMLYDWLNVDGKAKVVAEVEHLEKKERVKEISNNYPENKSFWSPFESAFNYDPYPWL